MEINSQSSLYEPLSFPRLIAKETSLVELLKTMREPPTTSCNKSERETKGGGEREGETDRQTDRQADRVEGEGEISARF